MRYENNNINAALERKRQCTVNYGADYDIYCEDDLKYIYDEYDKVKDYQRHGKWTGRDDAKI